MQKADNYSNGGTSSHDFTDIASISNLNRNEGIEKILSLLDEKQANREAFMKHINDEKWRTAHIYHPDSLNDRDTNHPEVKTILEFFEECVAVEYSEDENSDLPYYDHFDETEMKGEIKKDGLITVVNNYHGYCIACRQHIYSRSNPCDVISFFEDHVNNSKHIEKLLLWVNLEDKGMFKIDVPHKGLWKCRPCNESLKQITKKTTRSLKEEIKLHLSSSVHQFAASVIENPSISLMMSIATSSYFSDIVNAKNVCILCNEQIGPHERFKHQESQTHLLKLKTFLLENTELNDITKHFDDLNCLFEFLESLNLLEYFPEQEEIVNDESEPASLTASIFNDILDKTWVDLLQTHPDCLKNRKPCIQKYKNESIDIVNDVHAYCLSCRTHIYSGIDSNDIYSCFPKHLNTLKHLYCLESSPKEKKEVIKKNSKKRWVCCVCNMLVTKENYASSNLQFKIEEHVRTSNHKENADLIRDSKMCRLVGIAMSPMMISAVDDKGENMDCSMCLFKFPKMLELDHVKSKLHLEKVNTYLRNEMKVDVNNIDDDSYLLYVVEELVKLAEMN